jgi:hypothetical protein
MYRDHGFEIVEPRESPVPVEPLTFSELYRAVRWPGVFAILTGISAGAAVGRPWRSIAIFIIAFATMQLLVPRAFRRAHERKRNSLLA